MANSRSKSLMVKNGHVVCNATGSQRAFSLPTSKIRFFRIDKITKEVFSDGYYYNAPTLSYLNGPEDLVIPTDFGRYTATKIGYQAFYMAYGNSLIKSLTIPEGITHIGDSAFLGNYLIGNVTFPSTLVHIGEGAFQYCGFTTVVVPNSVTSIGWGAFANAPVSWNMPEITSITLGTGLQTIPEDLFANHPITSITIADGVVIPNYPLHFPNSHALGQFGSDFSYVYEAGYNKAAGTYTYSGGVWTKTA